MTTISLCMIVKNEEKLLSRCLKSVQNLVDEIILVDTGSTDQTIQIAQKHGATIYNFDWVNDFSAARNFSISKASGDWILWIDADESIEKVDKSDILRLLDKKVLGYEVQIHNISHEDKMPFIHKSMRLFQNGKGIQFTNKIHEQPSVNGNPLPYYELKNIPIFINHVGYQKEVATEKNKEERNFNILLEELKRKPKDKYLHFYIANEYLKREDYLNALYHYKVSTDNKKDRQMLATSILRMVLALHELKRYEELLSLIQLGKTYYPDYTDLYYFQADILETLGRYEEAVLLYEKCLILGEPKNTYITRKGIGDVLSLQKLVDVYTKLGYLKKAAEALTKLLSYNRFDKKVIISLLKIYRLNFSNSDLELVIKELYPSRNDDETLFKLDLAYTLRLHNLFAELYLQVAHLIPEGTKHNLKVFYHLSNKEYELAKELILKNSENDIELLAQYITYGECSSISKQSDIDKIITYQVSRKKNDILGLDKEVYVLFLKEQLLSGNREKIESALSIADIYENDFNGVVGNMLYGYHLFDLAAIYYKRYLELKPDDLMVNLVVGEIMLLIGREIDAVDYAQTALRLDDSQFRSIEIILEAYKQFNEHEQAHSLATEMLKVFPHDTYFKKF